MTRAAVFLDRDGTIIEDIGYLGSPDQIVWYPWSVDAIRALNRARLPVVVITNQSGIARGLLTERAVREVHEALDQHLAGGGARIDAYYYCPHHPEGTVAEYRQQCDCRKPACGLIERAARDLNLDPRRSVLVGDSWTDIAAARAAGARALLVGGGGGRVKDDRGPGPQPDAIVGHLAAAASWILTNVNRA